jgi:hypothetical protein
MISRHDPRTLLALLSNRFDAALSPEEGRNAQTMTADPRSIGRARFCAACKLSIALLAGNSPSALVIRENLIKANYCSRFPTSGNEANNNPRSLLRNEIRARTSCSIAALSS